MQVIAQWSPFSFLSIRSKSKTFHSVLTATSAGNGEESSFSQFKKKKDSEIFKRVCRDNKLQK